ncbi:MAG: SGNH/GDSL hydrolase family protein [Clostridia bacterium]|nr:SGNH/GDSL hydrolase family protein [Clostridia bacterium]
MFLTINQIKNITFGAVSVYEDNGYILFDRFTEKQKECYKNYRTISLQGKVKATAGVRFSFVSDTNFLKFNYILDYASSRDFAYFDILVNGELVAHIGKDKIDNSEKVLEVSFEKGEKHIEVYFPWSMKTTIRNLEISDGASLKEKNRSKTMIAYGDSITHGYDAFYPSNVYVTKLAKYFDADLFNKAIGGDTFFPELLNCKDTFIPDIVTVAYGTNDWKISTREEFTFNAKAFFEQLYENYNGSKIYVITPIWRLEEEDDTKPTTNWTLLEHRDFIKEIALQYENVTVIDGYELVPHDTELFLDKRLHPNDDGFKYYIENLIKAIEKTA